jgi:hypothetical protein
MIELHGAAVLICAALLSCGERRIWAFARALTSLQVRLRKHVGRAPAYTLPLPALSVTRVPPADPMAWHATPWCAPRPVRRGPPRLALSLA